MTRKDEQEPLRGDAAWAAQRKQVADNNEAAYKRGRERRADEDAKVASRRRDEAARDRDSLPEQPTP